MDQKSGADVVKGIRLILKELQNCVPSPGFHLQFLREILTEGTESLEYQFQLIPPSPFLGFFPGA